MSGSAVSLAPIAVPRVVGTTRGTSLLIDAGTDLSLAVDRAVAGGLSVLLAPGSYTTTAATISFAARSVAIAAQYPGTVTITTNFSCAASWGNLTLINLTGVAKAASTAFVSITTAAGSMSVEGDNVDNPLATMASRVQLTDCALTAGSDSVLDCVLGAVGADSQDPGALEVEIRGTCAFAATAAASAALIKQSGGGLTIVGQLTLSASPMVVKGMSISGNTLVQASSSRILLSGAYLHFRNAGANETKLFGKVTVQLGSLPMDAAVHFAATAATFRVSIDYLQVVYASTGAIAEAVIAATGVAQDLTTANVGLHISKMSVLGGVATLSSLTAPLPAAMDSGYLN